MTSSWAFKIPAPSQGAADSGDAGTSWVAMLHFRVGSKKGNGTDSSRVNHGGQVLGEGNGRSEASGALVPCCLPGGGQRTRSCLAFPGATEHSFRPSGQGR